jgi:4-hydroxy-tetrahydrodipicolinate synthase
LSAQDTASTIAGSFRHLSRFMFHGSIVALLTPFTEDGRIDFKALQRLVNFHVEAGTNAIVVAGTTGESVSLEDGEFSQLLSAVIEESDGRVPIVAGTGFASTSHTIEQSLAAQELGATAVLVVTPYYNKPPQAGLAAHYATVADAIEIPLIMYNVPSRTSVDLKPETAVQLATHPGIAGLKEAVPDPKRVEFLVANCPADFTVLSGDDSSCFAAMRAGAKGVISVASNVAPGMMHALCEAAAAGDWSRAEALNEKLSLLYETLALETNPIPVKWAAFELGLAGPNIRLPLTELSQDLRTAVRECLEELGIDKMEN